MDIKPVDQLMHALQTIIEGAGLELLQRYPNDLLVHDRRQFERFWAPGQRFGWMVGHSHTHMAVVGLHTEENKVLGYVLNLNSDDRFYEVTVGRDGRSHQVREVGRAGFESLLRTPVPYSRQGDDKSFTLFCVGRPVGAVGITITGTFENRFYSASIAPRDGAQNRDVGALHLWADYACRRLAGSLFYRSDCTVVGAGETLLVA